MKRFSAMVSCMALLAACQAAPPGKTESQVISGLGSQTNIVTTREFAGPTTYLGPMPTAVLVLTQGDEQRNIDVCNAFMKLPTTGQAQASGITPNIIPIRWPLLTDNAPSDCKILVNTNTYDYNRAKQLLNSIQSIKDINNNPSNIGKNGPYIVELIPTSSGIKAVIADASDTTQQAQYDQFVIATTNALLGTAREITVAATAAQPKMTEPGKTESWWQTALRSLWHYISNVPAISGVAKVVQGVVDTTCSILATP